MNSPDKNKMYILDKFRDYLLKNKLNLMNVDVTSNGIEAVVTGVLDPSKFTQYHSQDSKIHWVRLSLIDLYNKEIVGDFRF